MENEIFCISAKMPAEYKDKGHDWPRLSFQGLMADIDILITGLRPRENDPQYLAPRIDNAEPKRS